MCYSIEDKESISILEEMYFENMSTKEQKGYQLSKYNLFKKNVDTLTKEDSDTVQIGDVCLFDFGCAYRYEIGYQHFGIVVAKSYGKILVVPLISAKKDRTLNYRTKMVVHANNDNNLTHTSIALLNDTKWISVARIIKIIGNIDEKTDLFAEIQHKMIALIFSRE